MIRDRTLQTLALAASIIVIIGLVRPGDPAVTGMNYVAFEYRKMNVWRQWDLVLAGDSRSQMGLLPSAMQGPLAGERIYNFAFDHGGYGREYLDSLSSMLDPESLRPTLLLGITPQSLSPEAAANNQFAYLAAKRPGAALYDRYVGMYLDVLAPLDLRHLWREVSGQPQARYYRHYAEDGSVPSYLVPEDTLYQVNRYQGRFLNNQVSDSLVGHLLNQVRAWHDRGIEVYGIRLPTSLPMRLLEETESGFDEEEFIRGFSTAGGIWLPVPEGDFRTYDGSHLKRESAEALSRRLVEEIVRFRRKPPGSAPQGAKDPSSE